MPDTQFIDLNGVTLGYELRQGRGAGVPLVFGHGYALRSTGAVYDELFDALLDHFDIYALDLRGHGASAGAAEGWSQAALADDVAAFVRALGLQNAVYAGHSLGGFTGMFAQVRHPGTFAALCLLATAAASGGDAPADVATHFTANSHSHAIMRETFATMYMRPTDRQLDLAADAVALIPTTVHHDFYPNYANWVITDRLAEIDVPVLLVNGARDEVVPTTGQHATARGLPKSKEVVFSTEGHMLPLEAAAATAREILAFARHDIPELFAS